MANGWNGPDPAFVVPDPDTYELGTAYKANQDITITHIRIWTPAEENDLSGRTGTVWTTGGAVLGTVALPNDLPTGWSTHALATPVERPATAQWVVSYGTGGDYGFVSHGLDNDVPSADGAVTALGFASAPGGQNGRFNADPGLFPASGSAARAFYGADVVYTLGIGGNTAPDITAATVIASGMAATATITATDAETLTGATYRYDWGDGSALSSTNHPTSTAQHTYAVAGTYPILLSVTDADGASDYVARYVTISPSVTSPITASEVISMLASRTRKSKQFRSVLEHEPRSAPREFVTAAFFLGLPNAAPGGFQTIKRVSSLGTAGMRLDIICRLYMDAKKAVSWDGGKPDLDNIDKVLLEHLEVILRECHAAVSFGITDSGLWVDADGADSDGLGALIGYLDQDNTKFRIAEVYIPFIITDYFEQGK